ncbi:hypothetical protein SARC_09092 [Sphaeroforma arctica JP610]|uniref:C2H2-type domain-containing protein n=1 Tax=Sphaeroforma arctica JP610 TaxID=667725 RepID=A0A0L0FNT2_9EUKA|nr:hypothetical protein SARC_09092 [Sphaeroforma arctica JP610]KNC78477.1 hypothetical protein SARC_09092 [Sphaeroforma arctica JP610]|eukprot:XP_014152379.1 hypothetical protein SARC_09092 [Sphaeroforma arctica JP610]
MAEAEGMICPVCLSQFGSVGSLERHWAEAHSTTPTQTSAFKNFFKTLTRTAEEAFDATEDAILEDRDREKPQKQTLIDLKSMETLAGI